MSRMKGGVYRSELRAEQVAATRARIVEAAVEGFALWSSEMPFDMGASRLHYFLLRQR
ncbi:MAG TPA: hypothetical protein VF148_07480 [Acidimicrobiia bacterium]